MFQVDTMKVRTTREIDALPAGTLAIVFATDGFSRSLAWLVDGTEVSLPIGSFEEV